MSCRMCDMSSSATAPCLDCAANIEKYKKQREAPSYANTPTGDLEKRVNERFDALHTLLYQHSIRLDAHIELNRNFERNVIEKLEALDRSTTPQRAFDTEKRLDAALRRIEALERDNGVLVDELRAAHSRIGDAHTRITNGTIEIFRRLDKLEGDVALDRAEVIKSEKLIAALLDRVNQLVEFHGIAPIGGARLMPAPDDHELHVKLYNEAMAKLGEYASRNPLPEPCSVCGVDPTTREGFSAVAAKTRVIDGKRYCWACSPLPDEGT